MRARTSPAGPPAAPALALLAGGLLAAGGAAPAAAAAGPCEGVRLPAAEVRVEVEPAAAPPVDRTMDVLGLTKKARERSTVKAGVGRVVGLTTADFRLDVEQVRLAALPGRGGAGVCAAPTRVHVRLAAVQTVYVVRSMRHDACWEAAVLEHEMQHVAFNDEAVRATAGAARPRLEALARRPVAAADPEAAAGAVQRAIEAVVDEAARAAFAEAARRHASIDTPKAYNMLRARCGL